MMIIDDLFKIYTAKSKGFESYDQGEIPFISNGFLNNGVVGFVAPYDDDRTFDFPGICVSAFCEATVQKPPFMPRGNGGSGLIVLEPKKPLSKDELLFYSSYINKSFRWRFSFGRMVTKRRFKTLEIQEYEETKEIDKSLPENTIEPKEIDHNKNFKLFSITQLFDLYRGDFHALNRLDPGDYPTVSRVAYNSGVVGYFNKPDNAEIYPRYMITVSTVTGDAFVQLHDFIATDNVVICKPKQKFKLTTLFFIQYMLNSVKWRWSYGRQCYKAKFATTNIHLPILGGEIDESYIESIIINTHYWNQIKNYLKTNTRKRNANITYKRSGRKKPPLI